MKESIYHEAYLTEASTIAAAKTAAAVKAHVDSFLSIAVAAASELARVSAVNSGPGSGGSGISSRLLLEAVNVSPPSSLIYLPQRGAPPQQQQQQQPAKPTSNPLPSLSRLAALGANRQTLFLTPASSSGPPPDTDFPGTTEKVGGSRRSSMVEFASQLAARTSAASSYFSEERAKGGEGAEVGGVLGVEEAEEDEAWAKQHTKQREGLEKMFGLLRPKLPNS